MENTNTKKIEEILVKNYIRGLKRNIVQLARYNRIRQKDVLGAILLNNRLTEKYYLAEEFDSETIELLGIKNCCRYFKSCCEQLYMYKNGEEAKSYEKTSKVDIYFDEYKYDKKVVDIDLLDTAKTISDFMEIEELSPLNSFYTVNLHLKEYILENDLEDKDYLNKTLDKGIKILSQIPSISNDKKEKKLVK